MLALTFIMVKAAIPWTASQTAQVGPNAQAVITSELPATTVFHAKRQLSTTKDDETCGFFESGGGKSSHSGTTAR